MKGEWVIGLCGCLEHSNIVLNVYFLLDFLLIPNRTTRGLLCAQSYLALKWSVPGILNPFPIDQSFLNLPSLSSLQTIYDQVISIKIIAAIMLRNIICVMDLHVGRKRKHPNVCCHFGCFCLFIRLLSSLLTIVQKAVTDKRLFLILFFSFHQIMIDICSCIVRLKFLQMREYG